MRTQSLLQFFLVAVILSSSAGTLAHAQERVVEDEQNLFDWYYAAAFGTGVYRVGDRSITVFRIPFSYQMRSLDVHHWGLRLLLPVSVGLYEFDFDTILDLDLSEDVGILSFFPGVEFELPVRSNWVLKPFAHLGYTKEFSENQKALIYAAGLRSLATFKFRKFTLSLGNAAYYAGNTRDKTVDMGFGVFEAGVDIRHPLNMTLRGRQMNLSGYVIYWRYTDLEFIRVTEAPTETTQQLEVGLTLGTETPVSFLGFKFDRVGLGYRFGDDFSAIRLVASFPY